MRAIFLALAFSLTLAGCASDGKKTSCLQQVASAEIAVTESYESTATLYKADILSKDSAKSALKATDAANDAVDSAGRLCMVNEPSALDYLKEAAQFMSKANSIRGE